MPMRTGNNHNNSSNHNIRIHNNNNSHVDFTRLKMLSGDNTGLDGRHIPYAYVLHVHEPEHMTIW